MAKNTATQVENVEDEYQDEEPTSRFAGLMDAVQEMDRPSVGSGRQSDESWKDLLPLVYKAVNAGDKALVLTYPTDEVDDLVKSLRQAGDFLENPVTIRVRTEEYQDETSRVTFWATKKIRRPRKVK